MNIHGHVAGFHFALHALQHFAGGTGDHFYLDAGLGLKGGNDDVVQALITGAVNHQRFFRKSAGDAKEHGDSQDTSQELLHENETTFQLFRESHPSLVETFYPYANFLSSSGQIFDN